MTELLATCWTHSGTSVPYPGLDVSELSLRARAEAAASAGFTGFGIYLPDLDVALRESSLRDLNLLFEDLGLRHIEIEFLTDWWTDGERRADSDAERRRLLDAAEAFGARHIKIGAHVSKNGEPVPRLRLDRLAPALHALAAEAGERGTRLALEFLPMSDVATVYDALSLVTAADHPAAAICVDIWHVERGASTIQDVRNLPAERIAAVEINDAPTVVRGSMYEDTIHNRVLPGHGDFRIQEFIDAIQLTGFAGPWGVEILSSEERKRPIAATLADSYQTTMPYFPKVRN